MVTNPVGLEPPCLDYYVKVNINVASLNFVFCFLLGAVHPRRDADCQLRAGGRGLQVAAQ